jgi:hypothetical protein
MSTQDEINGWNAHRERHRAPPSKYTSFKLRRSSRREKSPHDAAVHGFTVAIHEAEKHRRTLKKRFGYTDQQIGTMAVIHQRQLDRKR